MRGRYNENKIHIYTHKDREYMFERANLSAQHTAKLPSEYNEKKLIEIIQKLLL